MRDQTVGQADALSLALAEPDQHVRRRWILGLTLASLGMWMATQTPLQVMLALQLQDITPRHKVVALAVLMVLLALPFVLFTPDHPLAPHDREPFSWRRLASSYWLSPREYPDFGPWPPRSESGRSRASAEPAEPRGRGQITPPAVSSSISPSPRPSRPR